MIDSPVESFRTHSNYIRAFATLVGADSAALADKVVQSGCLPNHLKTNIDTSQIFSSLKNAWGTELLINIGKYFVDEPELIKLSNNWSIVQAYYVLYHSTQAVAVAKGIVRPQNHPITQKIFRSMWADRNLYLEPWTISYGFSGAKNIPPTITINGNIHNWCHCSSDTAWSLACKALKTTRADKLSDAFNKTREIKKKERIKLQTQDEAERIRLGKRPKITSKVPLPRLTPNDRQKVDMNESPTTLIDYLYRLRVRTNYEDSSMFTDGPENEQAPLQIREDLSIIAGGTLLLAELTISKAVGRDVFLKWLNDWVCANVPNKVDAGIRNRLKIHTF